MYSSSYSRAKFGQEAREPLHTSRGKSCGYYVKIVFFFSSLIQSLIIVSLVLFFVYGQPEKSALEMRVKELEQGFNRLSENNIQLRSEKADLGTQLGARAAEKAALEKDLEKMKSEANTTEHGLKGKLALCEATRMAMMRRPTTPVLPSFVSTGSSLHSGEVKTLQSLNNQQKAMIDFISSNFTQTVRYLSEERDRALKDKDTHHQDAINQRRENDMLKEQLTLYTRKCKEDFAHSLDGIQTVTKDFLSRINNLFPHQMTFHLTCDSQQEQMEKIRNSCTNLSRDVENKFQLYLDKVGDRVVEIQTQSSRLEVQNSHLTSDMQQCERNRIQATDEAAKQLDHKQRTHDIEMEKLLNEQKRLRDQRELEKEGLAVKERELQTVRQMLSNMPKCGFKPAGLQVAPPRESHTVPGGPSMGVPGISKTPTVR